MSDTMETQEQAQKEVIERLRELMRQSQVSALDALGLLEDFMRVGLLGGYDVERGSGYASGWLYLPDDQRFSYACRDDFSNLIEELVALFLPDDPHQEPPDTFDDIPF